jgi:hypothetical protein
MFFLNNSSAQSSSFTTRSSEQCNENFLNVKKPSNLFGGFFISLPVADKQGLGKKATQALVVTSLFLSLLVPSSSSAETFRFSLLGALTNSDYHYSSDLSISTQRGIAFGGGAMVDMEIDPFLGVEGGIWYLTHSYTFNSSVQPQDRTYRFLDIPILLRFSPINEVALYLGPYYGVEMGSKDSDLGLLGGIGLRYPIAPNWKLRFDGFYQFGFANLDSTLSSQQSRNILVLAGILFETW